eukprot:1148623-Pelagomonas_calceolata.AAC.2
MGIWRVSGSTRLQILAVRSMIIFNGTPGGNKLVGVHSRMGMKLASKFNGTLKSSQQQVWKAWLPSDGNKFFAEGARISVKLDVIIETSTSRVNPVVIRCQEKKKE